MDRAEGGSRHGTLALLTGGRPAHALHPARPVRARPVRLVRGFEAEYLGPHSTLYDFEPFLASGDQRQVGTPETIVLEQRYAMELSHDGEESFEVHRDGESIGRLGRGARRSGAMVLAFETTPAIEVSGLVIEGKLTEDSLAAARAALVRRRVWALGL